MTTVAQCEPAAIPLPCEPFEKAAEKETRRWFAVQTRTRFERNVGNQLEQKGIEHFLPIVPVKHKWSDRTKLVDHVLFPNYLFVHISEDQATRIAILRMIGVMNFVGIRGIGVPIPDAEIQSVQTLLEHGLPIQLHSFLNIGQMVRVRGGCLDGVEGILTAINGHETLVISVHLIQRSVAMRIRGFHVEPVKSTGSPRASA
jgi:transcription antitermination factor NusG